MPEPEGAKHAIQHEMTKLENDFHAPGRPDEVPYDQAIAELARIDDMPLGLLDRIVGEEVGRAMQLTQTNYAPLLRKMPLATVSCYIGFLQGVTFARAAFNLRERSGVDDDE